jgi:hypothetical protein
VRLHPVQRLRYWVTAGDLGSGLAGVRRYLDEPPSVLGFGTKRPRAARKCSSHSGPYRPHATVTALAASAETFSDRVATSYGSEGRGVRNPSERALVPAGQHDGHLVTRLLLPPSGRILAGSLECDHLAGSSQAGSALLRYSGHTMRSPDSCGICMQPRILEVGSSAATRLAEPYGEPGCCWIGTRTAPKLPAPRVRVIESPRQAYRTPVNGQPVRASGTRMIADPKTPARRCH